MRECKRKTQTVIVLSLFLLSESGSFATERYLHPDHLGSTAIVTDGSGRITEVSQYTPFGEEIEGDILSIDYLYTGQEEDRSSDLYDYRARYYDPAASRFTSVDPAFDGMNPYAYVRGNPIRHTDPTGASSDEPPSLGELLKRLGPPEIDPVAAIIDKRVQEAKNNMPEWPFDKVASVLSVLAGVDNFVDGLLALEELWRTGTISSKTFAALLMPFVAVGMVGIADKLPEGIKKTWKLPEGRFDLARLLRRHGRVQRLTRNVLEEFTEGETRVFAAYVEEGGRITVEVPVKDFPAMHTSILRDDGTPIALAGELEKIGPNTYAVSDQSGTMTSFFGDYGHYSGANLSEVVAWLQEQFPGFDFVAKPVSGP